jgi:DNA polymerase II small subunit
LSEKERVQQAVSFSLTAGYNIDQEAFNLLTTISKTEDPVKLVEAVLNTMARLEEKPFFIDRALLEQVAKELFSPLEAEKPLPRPFTPEPLTTGKSRVFHPHAKSIEKDIKVLADPTGNICSTGSVNEYLEYFQDRFKRIKGLLRQRMDSRNAVSIRDAFRAPSRSKLKIFCMVTRKRESKHGIFLEIEDLEAHATALVPENASTKLLEKTRMLLPDQVVCIGLAKGKRNLLIVEDLFFPDIPQNRPRKAKEAVSVALISDLHVGSKEFMKKQFTNFTLWLNGKYGDEDQKDVASNIKYIIVAGDIVDGVGIYPNQIKELTVQDIFKQYKLAGKLIEQIPDYIEMIVIPGNHDATRKALPQPAIPKDYVEPLSDTRPVMSLGNPSTVRIHGVEFLIYHGRSLDDVLATAANMDFHSPERAMRLLLKGRHLAPSYGQRTLIAPEKRDMLVIEQVPDIFHVGHVHVMRTEFYRGTLMVNSGAWQSQTSYQRNAGLEPTPGIIPVVDLQTLSVLPMDFTA